MCSLSILDVKQSKFHLLCSENSKFANSLCFLVHTATCAHANDETKLVLVTFIIMQNAQ